MRNKSGFVIVEVLLAIVILSILFVSMFSTLSFLTNRTQRSKYDSQASTLMQEGLEISRSSMLVNWTDYSAGTYRLVFNASKSQWTLVSGTEGLLQGKFTRKIEISDVCRSNSGEIVSCPGTKDLQSKVVTVSLAWKEANIDKSASAKLLIYKTKT